VFTRGETLSTQAGGFFISIASSAVAVVSAASLLVQRRVHGRWKVITWIVLAGCALWLTFMAAVFLAMELLPSD
jgi:hypothetical protein